jgi:hypothetical protein
MIINYGHETTGLSYDIFIEMVQELFGCNEPNSPEMPINRTAVVHLVGTANPKPTRTKIFYPTSLKF